MLPGCKQEVTSDSGLQAGLCWAIPEAPGLDRQQHYHHLQLLVFRGNCVGMGNQKGPPLQGGLLKP